MSSLDDPTEARRDRVRLVVMTLVVVLAAIAVVWYVQNSIPRRIVLASGVKDASYHFDAQRYAEILARDRVTVVERMTGGAGENATLLRDPRSDVDVAFMEGGVIPPADQGDLVMLASLRYEPIWVFYRSDAELTRLDELRYRRVAIGAPGNGGRILVEPLLAKNDITASNTTLLPLGNRDALRALQDGAIDAAIMVGATSSPIIWQALHDEQIKLMSFADAEAYVRLFTYLSRVTLPAGTIEMSHRRIPASDVTLVATKAMLVAHESLPPALVTLLFEAARDLHGKQGYFEAAQQFPGTVPADLPVSADADRHNRFGPSFLHRHLPFWVATFAERLIVVVLPILVVAIPVINFLPQVIRWRMRSRIYRWYGELKLLERDVEARTGVLPVDQWLADLNRIERAAEHIKIPPSFASESYTLREHINFVRRAVQAKIEASGTEKAARTAAYAARAD
jgi:TRAP-type uncharacterized transport system substrate-binding protein